MAGRELDRALEEMLRQFSSMHSKFTPQQWKYTSPYDFYYREGGSFSSEPYTPEEIEILRDAFGGGRRRYEIQRCFYNAQTLALMESTQLDYAEGYIIREDSPIAVHHAWAVLNGKPVDVTLRPLGEKTTCDPEKLIERASRNMEENAYWGVLIPNDDVRKTWLRTEFAMSVLEDPAVQERVLKRGKPRGWKRPELSGSAYGGGCPPEMKAFGQKLHEFFYSPEVFVILGDAYDSWVAGGCWIAAEALKRWMRPHAELWAIHDAANILQHVVVRLGDCFLDGDGVSTRRELLKRWVEQEGVVEPKLKPFSEQQADAFGLVCPADLAEQVTKALEGAFGPWMAA